YYVRPFLFDKIPHDIGAPISVADHSYPNDIATKSGLHRKTRTACGVDVYTGCHSLHHGFGIQRKAGRGFLTTTSQKQQVQVSKRPRRKIPHRVSGEGSIRQRAGTSPWNSAGPAVPFRQKLF